MLAVDQAGAGSGNYQQEGDCERGECPSCLPLPTLHPSCQAGLPLSPLSQTLGEFKRATGRNY